MGNETFTPSDKELNTLGKVLAKGLKSLQKEHRTLEKAQGEDLKGIMGCAPILGDPELLSNANQSLPDITQAISHLNKELELMQPKALEEAEKADQAPIPDF